MEIHPINFLNACYWSYYEWFIHVAYMFHTPGFSNHKPTLSFKSTSSSLSVLPPSNQQPMDRTKTLPYIFDNPFYSDVRHNTEEKIPLQKPQLKKQ